MKGLTAPSRLTIAFVCACTETATLQHWTKAVEDRAIVQVSNARAEFACYKCQVHDNEKERALEKKALQQEIKHLKHENDRGEKKLKGLEKAVAEKHSMKQHLRAKLANKDVALEQAKQKFASQGGKGRLKVA